MNSQKFTYTVELDAASAQATAQKLAQIYQQSLAQIKMPVGADSGTQAMVGQARAAQAQITADAKAQASQRTAAAQAEAAAVAAQARASGQAVIDVERQVTQQVKAEINQRNSARSGGGATPGGLPGEIIPGFGALSAIGGVTLGGMALGQVASQGYQYLKQADELSTAYNRQSIAAVHLAGSQEKLNSLMKAYDDATGGAVDKATALAQVTRLQTLGFADSAEELERFARGARGAALAMGSNSEYIISQAQLAIANTSTMRLDQLGIGVAEFKERLDEVKESTDGLSESAAYQEALLSLWEDKFGAITDSAAAQASGMEQLTTAWTNYKLAVGQSGWFNQGATAVAQGLDALHSTAQEREDAGIQSTIDKQRRMLESGKEKNLGVSGEEMRNQLATLEALESLFKRQQELTAQAVPGARMYAQAIQDMTFAMEQQGRLGDEYLPQLSLIADYFLKLSENAKKANVDLRESAEVSGGVITKSQALAMGYGSLQEAVIAYNNAQGIANSTMAATVGLMSAMANGTQWVNLPGTGWSATQGPGLPDAEYFKRKAITQGGGFLTPGGNSAEEYMKKAQEENVARKSKEYDEAERKKASDAAKASREWESAAKKTQNEFEAAAKKMADTFESSLEKIEGLFSPSSVTDTDMALSAAGVYKPKADEWLRRLKDEVESGQDKYADVDVKDAARRVGLPESLDPKLIYAAVAQAWSDQSLFANKENMSLINWDAVARGETTGQQSALGKQNIIDWAGLHPEIVAAAGLPGILPGRMGGKIPDDWMQTAQAAAAGAGGSPADMMSQAMMAAPKGFPTDSMSQFGLDAVTQIATAMTGEQAQAQWDTLGTTIGQMMTHAIEEGIAGTNFVDIVVAEALSQLNDALETGAPPA